MEKNKNKNDVGNPTLTPSANRFKEFYNKAIRPHDIPTI